VAAAKKYWLVKSEPGAYSIDDLDRDVVTCWDGIRNYQARNFMRDEMKVGNLVLFYHSNAEPPAVVGLARVCEEAYPDHTAWDRKNDHFDQKSTPNNPVWVMVDLEFVEKFPKSVSLPKLREAHGLDELLVTRRGQRLSIQPVAKTHFQKILALAGSKAKV